MERKILITIKEEIKKYVGIDVDIMEDQDEIFDYIVFDGLNRVGSIVFYSTNGYKVQIITDEKDVKACFPCLLLNLNQKIDKDLSNSFKDRSLEEIRNDFDCDEYIRTIRNTSRIIYKLHINLNGQVEKFIKDESGLNNFSIENEGGSSIQFYFKGKKILEKNTNREIKALLDIGGQFCERLVPILL
ncbi:MAG: hypothetical protein MJA82_18045 [Clostridia bacterium]|nr:hypothetical protein [Clostridia bacterium]